jgi:sugar phosphate isomerase/epimerase
MPRRHAPHVGHDRRRFLWTGLAATAAATLLRGGKARAAGEARMLFSGYGITAPVADAEALEAAGADYLVDHVGSCLMPDRPDAEFERLRAQIAGRALPVKGCNVFLSGPGLRVTGPDADPARVLAYAAIAFRRLALLGGSFIGFGSGDARRIPEGWPKATADEQFTGLLRAMGPLARQHGIVVAVEQQRSAECNYLNRLGEVVSIVRAVDHPNIRVLADLYHMAVMGDGPEAIGEAGPWLSLVEIAEKAERTLPGVHGDDFRPYFRALAKAGYAGPITIEATGSLPQIRAAFTTLRGQARDVMAAL